MRKLIAAMLLLAATMNIQAKTLILYYSYTNTCKTTVDYLNTRIQGADMLAVEPAGNYCYECDGYAIGMQQLNAINAAPGEASSYPAINTTIDNLADYDAIIIACPLWWSQMATPMQAFLFRYGSQMAGKQIFMIVASASSGISGVVSRARALIPQGNFIDPALHIYSSDTRGTTYRTKVDSWLKSTNYEEATAIAQVKATQKNGEEPSYDTAGARIRKSARGIHIRRGKKTFVK